MKTKLFNLLSLLRDKQLPSWLVRMIDWLRYEILWEEE